MYVHICEQENVNIIMMEQIYSDSEHNCLLAYSSDFRRRVNYI